MPKNKDLKRLIRARMEKTGEAYTTARAQLLAKGKSGARAAAVESTAAPAAAVSEEDFASLAGMSDDAVATKTGRSWAQWVRTLDAAEAATWPHRQIAAHLAESFSLSAWWSQTVTVGYERIKGLRDVGQRRGGSYQANKSKTVPVPVERLYQAVSDQATRRRWLPDAEPEVTTATPHRSVRLRWDDDTTVGFWLTAKGDAKSQVQVQHRKLPDKQAAEEKKAYWGARLAALAELLDEG